MKKKMDRENFVVDVRNLSKRFGDINAVVDVSLQIKSGEIFGFLGPNGSGKTTTMRMICGLLTPDSGEGTCLGYDILTESRLIKRHVGYIPQFFGLYKRLSIYENLIFIAELYGVLNKRKKIARAMEQLGLSEKQKQLAGTLSGGWKQRLSLAAALLHDPLFLILDEPTASIDPNARAQFWELMHNLATEGMTILLTSHNMDEIAHCNRIIYISNGRTLASGEIDEIIEQLDLTTWQIQGGNINLLAKQLEVTPGIDQVITFYDRLHVSSQNKSALEKAIAPYLTNPNFTWQRTETTLADIFVWLAKKSTEEQKTRG